MAKILQPILKIIVKLIEPIIKILSVVIDLISMIFWIKTMPSQDKEAVEKIDSEGHKMLVKEKIDEYNEYVHKLDDKKDQGGLIA